MNCLHPFRKTVPRYDENTGEITYHTIFIPCGKCTLCHQSNCNNWEFRLNTELLYSTNAFFVTLTFDNEHLPHGADNGLKQTQDFLKRFRKNYNLQECDFKYYIVSELGGEFGRLHYHAIFYNVPALSLHQAWQIIATTWNQGFVYVSWVTPKRVRYVTKYIFQHQHNPPSYKFKDKDTYVTIKPPRYFSRRVSNGMGRKYLTPQMLEFLRARGDGTTIYNGRVRALPSYLLPYIWEGRELQRIKNLRLDKCIQDYEENPVTYEEFKKRCRAAGRTPSEMVARSSVDNEMYNKYLQLEEKSARISKYFKHYNFTSPPSETDTELPYKNYSVRCMVTDYSSPLQSQIHDVEQELIRLTLLHDKNRYNEAFEPLKRYNYYVNNERLQFFTNI